MTVILRPEQDERPKETEPLKVLLAEDDPTQRLVVAHLVRNAGYVVETVPDGDSALARILEETFDILITDLDMPGLDGSCLCRRIREASLANYLYILMLTSHTGDADVASGLEAGADDFVRKPANPVELLARLKNGSRIVKLQREAYRNSITDALLGVFNRRYLIHQLRCEVWRAHRYQRPLAVLMVDLDYFKQINDRFGHSAGDQVLVGFARKTRSLIRASDWFARFGGEEFVIVLPETPLDVATQVAEKLRRELESLPFVLASGEHRVTASFGVAGLVLGSDENSDAILGKADQALYRSKQEGRNRITVACEPCDGESAMMPLGLPIRS
jgi:two-component system cell cycle response regulator